MAFPATVTWECRRLGSDTNGGAVDRTTVVVDYSQQNTAQVAVTDAASAGSTTLTSATASFTANMVGNCLYLVGGTGSLAATRRVIKTFVNSTTITVDAVVGVGTGITMNLGGGLASIAALAATTGYTIATGHIAFVLNDGTPYSITSATVNISGGALSTTSVVSIIGYSTNRTTTNTDTPPTLQYGVSGISMFITRGLIRNIIVDGNGQTTAKSGGGSDSSNYSRVGILNMNTANGTIGSFELCWSTGCSAVVFSGSSFGCIGYSNTATQFTGSGVTYTYCISLNNTGSTTDGFLMSSTNSLALNCIAWNNGRSGFYFVGNSRGASTLNCIAENNAAFGFDTGTSATNSAAVALLLSNCAAHGNTSGDYETSTLYPAIISNFISLTGSAFTNAAGGDFSLNNTAGAGAACRATGVLGTFPTGVSTTGYQDIGAAQHQDTGGGGTTIQGFFNS